MVISQKEKDLERLTKKLLAFIILKEIVQRCGKWFGIMKSYLCFQMEQGSGIQAISLTKPQSLEDLAAINSVMRLMASERGAEQPLNKYARFKANFPEDWEQEMIDNGLTKEERLLMHSYLDYEYGVCATQKILCLWFKILYWWIQSCMVR